MTSEEKSGRLKRLLLFAVYGAMMFAAKTAMEGLPNIHPLGMFVMTFTVVYGIRALVPIYVYVALEGLFHGFTLWWLPYLYIWTIYCFLTLLLPKYMKRGVAMIVYPVVCGIFGIMFGVLYAPAQAILFHLNFKSTVAWIVSGLSFDVLHALGNLGFGLLVLPLSETIKKLHKSAKIPIK